jgi:hypothetical protein
MTLSPLRRQLGPLGVSQPLRKLADLLVVRGATEIWPLLDMVSGTTIPAYINSARNGVESGWDLQNAASPIYGDTRSAPYSDGGTDFGNIFTSSLSSVYNGSIGSMLIFAKVDAAAWTDGTQRCIMRFLSAGTAPITFTGLYKSATNNSLMFQYTTNGGGSTFTSAVSLSTWFCVGMSWKDASNGAEFRGFLNGAQIGSTVTVTTSNAKVGLSTTNTCIGAANTAGAQSHKGHLAMAAVKYGSVWTPSDFAEFYRLAQ